MTNPTFGVWDDDDPLGYTDDGAPPTRRKLTEADGREIRDLSYWLVEGEDK